MANCNSLLIGTAYTCVSFGTPSFSACLRSLWRFAAAFLPSLGPWCSAASRIRAMMGSSAWKLHVTINKKYMSLLMLDVCWETWGALVPRICSLVPAIGGGWAWVVRGTGAPTLGPVLPSLRWAGLGWACSGGAAWALLCPARDGLGSAGLAAGW